MWPAINTAKPVTSCWSLRARKKRSRPLLRRFLALSSFAFGSISPLSSGKRSNPMIAKAIAVAWRNAVRNKPFFGHTFRHHCDILNKNARSRSVSDASGNESDRYPTRMAIYVMTTVPAKDKRTYHPQGSVRCIRYQR